MNKYIFLDFDGVLNSYRSDLVYQEHHSTANPEHFYGFDYTNPKWDPIAVGLVRKLVKETDAKVVISSSWRQRNTLEQIHTAFATYSWDTVGIIISTTPVMHTRRGKEIDTWLEHWHSSSTKNAEEYKYVILDDAADIDFLVGQPLVQTDPRVGFGWEDFQKALEILND